MDRFFIQVSRHVPRFKNLIKTSYYYIRFQESHHSLLYPIRTPPGIFLRLWALCNLELTIVEWCSCDLWGNEEVSWLWQDVYDRVESCICLVLILPMIFREMCVLTDRGNCRRELGILWRVCRRELRRVVRVLWQCYRPSVEMVWAEGCIVPCPFLEQFVNIEVLMSGYCSCNWITVIFDW